jgi:hypothetical protein
MGRRKSEVALGLGGDHGPQPEDEAGCPVAETALRDRLDDLRRYVVGATGFEPVTPSVSAKPPGTAVLGAVFPGRV